MSVKELNKNKNVEKENNLDVFYKYYESIKVILRTWIKMKIIEMK